MHTLKTCLPAQAIEHHHHTSLHTVAVARTINRHNQSTLIQLLPISSDLRECYTTVFRLNKMCSSKLPTQVWQHRRDQSAREKGIWVLGVSIWCGEMGLGMGEITLRGAGGGNGNKPSSTSSATWHLQRASETRGWTVNGVIIEAFKKELFQLCNFFVDKIIKKKHKDKKWRKVNS